MARGCQGQEEGEDGEKKTEKQISIKSIKIDSTNPTYPLTIGSGINESPKFKIDWDGAIYASDITITNSLNLEENSQASGDIATKAYVDGKVNGAISEFDNDQNNNVNKKIKALEDKVKDLEDIVINGTEEKQSLQKQIDDLRLIVESLNNG